jgi:flagellar basal-body rod protein FlgC
VSIFQSMNTTASALTAQRLRMDVISSNMANVDTTRGKLLPNGTWEPYRRKSVILQPKEGSFSSLLKTAMNPDGSGATGNGVMVSKIQEDTTTPFKTVYDPENPDANQDGYVQLPNVDPLREMVDLMSATRSYEANVTVFNASKGMMMKALEIGK